MSSFQLFGLGFGHLPGSVRFVFARLPHIAGERFTPGHRDVMSAFSFSDRCISGDFGHLRLCFANIRVVFSFAFGIGYSVGGLGVVLGRFISCLGNILVDGGWFFGLAAAANRQETRGAQCPNDLPVHD
jgi:hypothetical protein